MTDAPFGSRTLELHSDHGPVIGWEPGHDPTARVNTTIRYDLARSVVLDRSPHAVELALGADEIEVDGFLDELERPKRIEASTTERLVLDPTAALIELGVRQPDDVKWVGQLGGVGHHGVEHADIAAQVAVASYGFDGSCGTVRTGPTWPTRCGPAIGRSFCEPPADRTHLEDDIVAVSVRAPERSSAARPAEDVESKLYSLSGIYMVCT
jgi:hypothetical protein